MFKYEGDDGTVSYGDTPEEACIDGGLEEFDLEPTSDEEALKVYVSGDVVGIVTEEDERGEEEGQ